MPKAEGVVQRVYGINYLRSYNSKTDYNPHYCAGSEIAESERVMHRI